MRVKYCGDKFASVKKKFLIKNNGYGFLYRCECSYTLMCEYKG